MQSAIDRRTESHIYAGLVDPDVWDAEYRHQRRWKDGLVLECPACARPVYGKSGHDELAQVPVHFAHVTKEHCPYAEARRESGDHIRLKQDVARIIEACGWHAQPEVPGPNWRADVLASVHLADLCPTGRSFNLDVVYASSHERRVAFEVQVSRQGPMRTGDRSRRYEKAGVEVVWLLGWIGAEAWRHPRAVSLVSGDLSVSTGFRRWQSRGGWLEPTSPLSLAVFIRWVLNDELQNRARGVTFEWIRASDIDRERRRRQSTERLKVRRAEAVRRIEFELRRMGLQPMIRPGDAADAYATVLTWRDASSMVHSAAIHPAPGMLDGAVKGLEPHDAVVVDDDGDRPRAAGPPRLEDRMVSSTEFLEQVARCNPPPTVGVEDGVAPATGASNAADEAPAETGRRRRFRSWFRRRRR